MIIDTNTAMRTLQSIDKQIKETANIPEAKSTNQLLQDTIELSGSPGKGKATSAQYNSLIGEAAQQLQPLLDLIGGESQRQGELSEMFGGGSEEDIQARAQELLEGYFNVENTGNRIFDFAFSFYEGGDREAYARDKQALIHEGFRQAEKVLGGLADISLETRDYIDQRVEDFIDEGQPASKAEVGEPDEAQGA